MSRSVLTVADLEHVASGGEVAIPRGTLVTPLAREEAERRGITLRVVEPEPSIQPGGESAKTSAQPACRAVAIGADHGGYELKEQLKSYLRDWGYTVLDMGTDSTAAVDYPDFAEAIASAVVRGEAWRGVVIDSAGIGSSIAANKVPGIRAALCYDRATARNSREHNDANVLSLGARMVSAEAAREILAVWLETPFAGGRHQRRVDKIRLLEARHLRRE
jgi:ribose 5-phosphate isomerase B